MTEYNAILQLQDLKNHCKEFCTDKGSIWNVDIEALDMAIKALDRQNADGCTGCTFANVEEWEMPCVRCKRGCKDYWGAKHGAKSEKTEEESDTQTRQDTF